MSSFVVSPLCISQIISSMRRPRTDTIRSSLVRMNPQKLTETMLKMNLKATGQRYGSTENADETYVFQDILTSDTQGYLSLRCFLYQCSAGSVPRMKLYKELQKISDQMAHNIARNRASVENAEWD